MRNFVTEQFLKDFSGYVLVSKYHLRCSIAELHSLHLSDVVVMNRIR